MTLDQIRVLSTIVQTGSFRGAAELLHRTQPTLSVAIRNLEREFGFELFDRGNYRPVLTTEGAKVLSQARKILGQVEELESLVQTIREGVETDFFIVFDALCPPEMISQFLRYFEKVHPQTRLRLSVEYVSGAFERVSTGEAQIALCPVHESLEEFRNIELFRVQMIPVAGPQFIDHLGDSPTIANLEQATQIVVGDSRTKGPRKDFGVLDRVKRWTVNDHALKLEMLRQGMGWGRLPEFLVREEIVKKNLIRLSESLISSISIPVYLLRKRNTVSGPVTQQVWDYFLGSIDAENSNHPA